MACYKPLVVLYDIDKITNKKKIKCITSPARYKKADNFLSFVHHEHFVYVPCGHCVGCRLDYARDWSNRIMFEAKDYDHNWFITLTYDNEFEEINGKTIPHLPVKYLCCFDDKGNVIDSACFGNLVKSDLQKFLKRLRKNSGQKFRYYAAGEYGSKTMRPHFHICLLDFNINDLHFDYQDADGFKYYTSDFVSRTWNKGMVVINEMTRETVNYTARYCMKKLQDDFDMEVLGLNNEFIVMSRKPGIGKKYFEDNIDKIKKYDSLIINNNGNVYNSSLPRYYDKLLDQVDHNTMEILKAIRERKQRDLEQVPNCSSLDDIDYRCTQEKVVQGKIKSLKRSI